MKRISLLVGLFLVSLFIGAFISRYVTDWSITGFAVYTGDTVIEKTAVIEVWANTSLNFYVTSDSNLQTHLKLDDSSDLVDKNIDLYLNDILFAEDITDIEGYISSNLGGLNPGTYSLKAEFQEDPLLYLNKAVIERSIEVSKVKGVTTILLLNETTINQTLTLQGSITVNTDKLMYLPQEIINISGVVLVENQQINGTVTLDISLNGAVVYSENVTVTNGIFLHSLVADFVTSGTYILTASHESISASTAFYSAGNGLGGVVCEEFTEEVLWLSNYTLLPEGSVRYQSWQPRYNCTSVNASDCFITSLEIETRFLHVGKNNEVGEGYVQISNPESPELTSLICDNPQLGTYEKYIAYDSLLGEGNKKGKYCGNNKNQDARCGIDNIQNIQNTTFAPTCYGLKSYVTNNFLLDVFEVKYNLCWRENEQ